MTIEEIDCELEQILTQFKEVSRDGWYKVWKTGAAEDEHQQRLDLMRQYSALLSAKLEILQSIHGNIVYSKPKYIKMFSGSCEMLLEENSDT